MSSLLSNLSADCVLHILSFHTMNNSDLIRDLPFIPQLYGHFVDDPNREKHFLFTNFVVRCGVADANYSPIFKNAMTLQIKAKSIDSTCTEALARNFRLISFVNEEAATCSATAVALQMCKQLQNVKLAAATEFDMLYIVTEFRATLKSLTVGLLTRSEEDREHKVDFNSCKALQHVHLGEKKGSLQLNQLMEPEGLFGLRSVTLNYQDFSDVTYFDNSINVRFLDLSNCVITKAIMYKLAQQSGLKVLRLNSCNLTSDIVSPLFDTCCQLNELISLHMKVNPKVTFKAFKTNLDANAIQCILPKLRTVNMSGCKLGPKGADLLARLCGKTLRIVYLRNSWIGTKGLASIMQQCSQLQSINASEDKITLEPSIMESGPPIVCHDLRRLKLRQNAVTPQGMKWFCEYIEEYTPNFWSIELNDNPTLGDEGAKYLLQSNLVKTLSLNNCDVTDSVVCHYMENNTVIESIYLAENKLTDLSAECLLARNKTLKTVVLSKNEQITDRGALFALQTSSCERVWMDNCPNISARVKQEELTFQKLPAQIVGFRI